MIGLALTVVSFIQPPNRLVGRWQKRLPDGSVGMGIFRSDSSYDLVVNGKVFISGKYYVRQDTLVESDGACRLPGTYRLHFFTQDSVRLTVIRDSCHGRREGYDGLTMGRVKPTKP